MVMRRLVAVLLFALFASTATAQFTGPGATGQTTTVRQLSDARLGSYVTVTGNIVAHQRKDYFTFRDDTGEIRVEIEDSIWQGRQIGPETRVTLLGEVDVTAAGRYVWVKSLQLAD
jgi:uncharacterized protein (TIGR00156 family)